MVRGKYKWWSMSTTWFIGCLLMTQCWRTCKYLAYFCVVAKQSYSNCKTCSMFNIIITLSRTISRANYYHTLTSASIRKAPPWLTSQRSPLHSPHLPKQPLQIFFYTAKFILFSLIFFHLQCLIYSVLYYCITFAFVICLIKRYHILSQQ